MPWWLPSEQAVWPWHGTGSLPPYLSKLHFFRTHKSQQLRNCN
eukprot:SAG25_NODE_5933_length_604_cov_0.819802_1_plen_42_part_10